jgi:hypothetical protein
MDEFWRGNETAFGLETQSCVVIVTGGFGHGPLRDPCLRNPPVTFWGFGRDCERVCAARRCSACDGANLGVIYGGGLGIEVPV